MEINNKYNLLYKKYTEEIEPLIPKICMDYLQFESMVSKRLQDASLIDVEVKDEYGFLYYFYDENQKQIYVPSFGYYAENERVMVSLFKNLAEKFGDSSVEYSFNIYSHDFECLNALHMLQFGNIAEKGINKISFASLDTLEITIRELTKDEVEDRWQEVWNAVSEIIDHLKKSPIFYKGDEFKEDIYKEYFMDETVHVVAALKDEKIIGIIKWNEEETSIVSKDFKTANVGEAYVKPQYRGTGLAKNLLSYASNSAYENGLQYMWVEHGTANPEARGFWNKYFKTYQYELVRTVNN